MMLIVTMLMFLGLWRSFAAGKVLRILDGKIVKNNKYPFAVTTRLEMEGKVFQGCSGSLIAAQWVLTAAHCILPGTSTRNFFVGNETHSYRKVLKFFPHPNYQVVGSRYIIGWFASNDIGLILIEKLEGVKLATVSAMDYKSLSGLPVTFAGFGNMNKNLLDPQDIFVVRPLRIGEGVVINCNPKGKHGLSPGICVAPKCNTLTTVRMGDSGGPLMFRDTIIGVTSGPGETPVIGAFCPVSPYLEWINVVMTTQQ